MRSFFKIIFYLNTVTLCINRFVCAHPDDQMLFYKAAKVMYFLWAGKGGLFRNRGISGYKKAPE